MLDARANVGHCPIMQWTPEQARANLPKSHQSHRDKRKKLKEREQLLDNLVKQAAERLVIPPVVAGQPNEDPLLRLRLNNVNARITECDARLQAALADDEVDGTLVKNLSTALGVLDGIEQRLSGRPGPGNLRPVAPRRQVATFTPPADS